MATDVYLRVVPGGLMCLSQAEAEKLEDLVGQEVRAMISRPRNIAFHRKFFALLKVARDMCPEEYNPEQFRAIVLAGAGHCEFIAGKGGALVAVPKSISFAKCDEIEFSRIYNSVLNYCCDRWAMDQDQIDQMITFMY